MKVISVDVPVILAPFHVFQIGSNQSYLNQGHMDHCTREEVVKQLETLCSLRLTEDVAFCFSGPLLSFLEEERPDLLEQLNTFISSHSRAHLALQPYYTTYQTLFSDSTTYIRQHAALLDKHFSKTPTYFVGGEHDSLPSVSSTSSLSAFLSQQEEHFSFSSELQTHILDELHSLAPHVFATEDQELISSFLHLSSPSLLHHMHPDHSNDPYDAYTAHLSILHDITHRILVAKQLEKGIISQEIPSLHHSPSSYLSKL